MRIGEFWDDLWVFLEDDEMICVDKDDFSLSNDGFAPIRIKNEEGILGAIISPNRQINILISEIEGEILIRISKKRLEPFFEEEKILWEFKKERGEK
jgi:hypothetical protein